MSPEFTRQERPVPVKCQRCHTWYNANKRDEVSRHLNCQIELAHEVDFAAAYGLDEEEARAGYPLGKHLP